MLFALALTASTAVGAQDLGVILGVIPGEPVPNLLEDFRDSPFRTYEKPTPEGPLSEYFQYLEITVLAPDTVAVVAATRAYDNGLICWKERERLHQQLSRFFPTISGDIEDHRLSFNKETRMSLSCSTSGAVPYYSLTINISHLPTQERLLAELRGPNH